MRVYSKKRAAFYKKMMREEEKGCDKFLLTLSISAEELPIFFLSLEEMCRQKNISIKEGHTMKSTLEEGRVLTFKERKRRERKLQVLGLPKRLQRLKPGDIKTMRAIFG